MHVQELKASCACYRSLRTNALFMSTLRDILHYLSIYRRYIGRRMYLVFVLTVATALAQGFGITLLLPLLQASQTTSGVRRKT